MGDIRRVLPWALLTVAGAYAVVEIWAALGVNAVGMDFLPLRHAAESLTRGTSVYTDRDFVYPPTAVLILLPFILGTPHEAFVCWLLLCAAGLLGSAALVCRRRMLFAGVLLLLGGCVAHRSLFLGNMSELLVPLAAGAVLAFRRDRWTTGCALLAASLLVKPLLLPLLAVPLVHRRFSELLRTLVPAAVALGLAMWLMPGGSAFPRVLRYCFSATNLHGPNAINNISLRGWAEAHGEPAAVILGYLVLAALIVRLLPFPARPLPIGPFPARPFPARPFPVRREPAWLSSSVLLAAFLAGSIAEAHFLLVLMALVLLRLRDEPPRAWLPVLPGLALFGVPFAVPFYLGVPPDGQSWFLAGELLLFLGLLAVQDRLPARAVVPAVAPA